MKFIKYIKDDLEGLRIQSRGILLPPHFLLQCDCFSNGDSHGKRLFQADAYLSLWAQY